MSKEIRKEEEVKNPYLLMDFWSFAIISTLVVVFFPFSLLFCVFYFGLEETKLLLLALLHDLIKTLLAVLSVLVPLIVLIFFLLYKWAIG